MVRVKKVRGFTLIELLAVITIIGILAVIALYSINSAMAKARDSKRKSDLYALKNALALYAQDNNGLYPINTGATPTTVWSVISGTDSKNSLDVLVANHYISALPIDPRSPTDDYQYQSTADGSAYALISVLESNPGQNDTSVTPGTYCSKTVPGFTGSPGIGRGNGAIIGDGAGCFLLTND